MATLDISTHEHWMAIAISGMLTTPLIPIGLGPDLYILEASAFIKGGVPGFDEAMKESFADFGQIATESLTLNNLKVIWVPLLNDTDQTIQDALKITDFALAIFNRNYFPTKARFIKWDRYSGKAIGVICSKRIISPMRLGGMAGGPALISAQVQTNWDWFFSMALRNQLSELGKALFKCIEWERESQNSSHITHRFAFNWVGLESMLPEGEIGEGDVIRRYSLIVGAPRGSDSNLIRERSGGAELLKKMQNPNFKEWVSALGEMYKYRCAIFHDGSSDLNLDAIDPLKIDWFYQLSKYLCMRVTKLCNEALGHGVTTVAQFWSNYLIDDLFRDEKQLSNSDHYHGKHLITFDWSQGRYPDIF